MPRFFVNKDNIFTRDNQEFINILGEDSHHISRSLRMAVGEKIEVCDFSSMVYLCELVEFSDGAVLARVLEKRLADSEPKHKITLYQALCKGEKMETIIQKATECGVYKVVPFRSEFCVVRLDSKDGKKKAERWQKIAESAAKQSGRGIIPVVCEPMDFKIATEDASKASLTIFCNERETEKTLKSVLQSGGYDDISVIIGSEGGFSQREADYIISSGAKSVTLGKRILRCETAPTFVLSAIAYETEME